MRKTALALTLLSILSGCRIALAQPSPTASNAAAWMPEDRLLDPADIANWNAWTVAEIKYKRHLLGLEDPTFAAAVAEYWKDGPTYRLFEIMNRPHHKADLHWKMDTKNLTIGLAPSFHSRFEAAMNEEHARQIRDVALREQIARTEAGLLGARDNFIARIFALALDPIVLVAMLFGLVALLWKLHGKAVPTNIANASRLTH